MILATYYYDCGAVLTVSKEDDEFQVRDKHGFVPFCPKIDGGVRIDMCKVNESDDVPSYQELGLFYALDMTECGW